MAETQTESQLRQVSRLFAQVQREGISCCGVSATQCALLTEVGRSGGLTLADLSRRVGLDKGWVSRAVDGLVSEGLLTKEPGAADRRTVNIRLSAAGTDRFAALNRTLNQQADQILAKIPGGEREQVLKALAALERALRPAPGPAPEPTPAPGAPGPAPAALRFRRADPGDWDTVARLLTAAGLPLHGAREHQDGFLLAHRGDTLAGTAALERYGAVALLRSVAVAENIRGTGLGQELVRLLLDIAYEEGVQTVALLTATADRFFPRFGFQRVERSALPPVLAGSEELRGACPASAVAMMLDLRRPATLVRSATGSDLPDIARIYNQGIEDRSTFETELRTVEERRAWLDGRDRRHPVIVAVRLGAVLGWASLGPFNVRQAYRHVADLSVYVERGERGTGVGTALLQGLVERARALAYHKLVLTTFPHKAAPVGLYKKFGFRTVGCYHEQGQLDGRWLDTMVMELLL
ncbi:MAG TPA: arsinothricin resistance N-acetyltransferase ArsN1 family A [Symbiobacteriaceae bacterium]|nr:arsinothricin resistance N-acetyltransferase ArsN1 family A [Symbiobacteriaceae bacterium]